MRVIKLFALALPLVAALGLSASITHAPPSAASSCPAPTVPSGSGTASDPYQISTPAELEWFKQSGPLDKNYLLTGHVDMTGCTWTSAIGGPTQVNGVGTRFTGVFDGGNLEIANLTITNGINYGATGLFWSLQGSVKNLGLVDLTVTSSIDNVGGIAGVNSGIIRDSYVTGSITGNHYTGGLVGYSLSRDSLITDSWFSGSVSGNDFVGGIIGRLGTDNDRIDIERVAVIGSVSGRNQVGGIIGEAGEPIVDPGVATGFGDPRVAKAVNFANVTGAENVGGIAGGMQGKFATDPYVAEISEALNYGTIKGTSQVGGIVGHTDDLMIVRNAANLGVVDGTGNDIGGIVGLLKREQLNSYRLEISNTISLGGLSGPDVGQVGPVIGKAEEAPSPSDYSRSLWSTDAITLQGNNNSNGIGRTETQLRQIATYSDLGFDIAECTNGSTVWLICTGDYPYLRSLGPMSTPDTPTGLTGVISSAQIDLTWRAPTSTQSNPVTGHRIEYKETNSAWSDSANVTVIETNSPRGSWTLDGLTNGITYDVRVVALNGMGASQPGSAVSFTVADVPSPPLSVLVDSVDDKQATVSWTAPSDIGGSAITRYEISVSSDDGSTWTYEPTADSTSAQTTVAGLTNNVSYRFRVVAVNSDGASSPSIASDAVVVGVVPQAPTDLDVVQRFADSIKLGWTAAAAGSSPLSGYTIEYSADGGTDWTPFGSSFAADSTSGTVSDLTEGQEYQFRAIASNTVGDSPPSQVLTTKVGLVPSAPLNPNATVLYESGGITLQWSAPTSPGSTTIDSYTIEQNINGQGWQVRSTTVDGSINTVAMEGWNDGDVVEFRVYATNSIGNGPFASSAAVTFQDATTPPLSVSAQQGASSLTVTWQTPVTLNGSTISEYKIDRSSDQGQTWTALSTGTGSTATSFEDVTAGDGQRYVYRVASVTNTGLVSQWSNASQPAIVSSCPATKPVGDGTIASPFSVASAQDLEWIRQNSSRWASVYTLAADIDMSNCARWVLTIGDSTTAFTGTFDGSGHTISGLDIDLGVSANAGMFGYLGATARVSNLALQGSVNGGDAVGSLAGFVASGAIIDKVATVVQVVGSSRVGGLVGELAGQVSNSYSLGPVTASTNNGGGLVGSLSSTGQLSNSYSTGTITSVGTTGGLVATADSGSSVTSSYWNTTTSGVAASAAGTGKTATQLREPATYAGWSLAETCGSSQGTWQLCNTMNFGYPRIVGIGTPGVVGVPTAVTAVAGDGTATVTWTASTDNSHYPITGYTITAAPGGATCSATTGNPITTSCVFTGLPNAQPYTFTVTATNALATTAPSVASNSVTPIGSGDFVSTWTTTSNGQSITLPLVNNFGADHNFVVNWGDGSVETVTSSAPVDHTYATAGTYTVRIAGTLVGWSFGSVPASADAITDISQWGSFTVTDNIGGAFQGASNLDVSATDAPNLSGALILDNFFKGATSLSAPDLSSWDLSNAVSLSSFFEGASSFNTDLSSWNTSNAQQMNYLLKGATNFDQDLGSWSVSALVNAVGFLDDVKLSDSKYEALLVGWSNQNPPNRYVGFSGGTSTWQAGGASGNARAVLAGKGWNISDGGGKPSAPRNLTVTPGAQELLLQWNDPESNGGSLITRYEYSLDGGAWVAMPGFVDHTLDGLDPGVAYSVRIRAVNSIGIGLESAAVTGTPTLGTPDRPSNIVATQGDGQLDLTFTITDNGGSPIQTVEYSADGNSGWNSVASLTNTSGSQFSATIDGLTNGVAYTFYLRASNGTTTSGASSSFSGTPATAPSAPVISATAQSGGFSLSLDAVVDSGGSAITGYQYQVDSGQWQSVASLPVTVTGLVNGTTYSVIARAVNTIGPGASSAPISVTPHASAPPPPSVTAPSAPTSVSATRGNQRIDLTFQITDTGGSLITDIEYSINGGSGWVAVSSFTNTGGDGYSATITGLTNGTQYSVALRATNNAYWSTASNPITATPATTPTAPHVTVSSSGDVITIAFNALPSDGGSSIIRYEYQIDSAGWSTISNFPLTLSGNNPGIYTVDVRAVNDVGDGSASSNSVEVTSSSSPTAPGQVTDLTAYPGNTSISLTWTAASGTVTDYQINTGDGWVDLNSTSTATTLTNLTNGVSYTAWIRAVNNGVVGVGSSPVTAIPGLPGQVANLVATPQTAAIELSWTAPDQGAAAISQYEYSIDGGFTWSSTNDTDTTFIVPSLSSDVTYSLQVRAVNQFGPGTASATVTGTPLSSGGDGSNGGSKPTAPQNVTFTSSGTSITITWDAPANDGGSPITGYLVLYAPDGSQQVVSVPISDPTARTHTITGLQSGGAYLVGVGAENSEGVGAGVTQTITVGDAPGSPGGLETEPGNQSVNLSWTAPSFGSSPITDYEYSTNSGSTWTSLSTTGTSASVTGLLNGTDYTFIIRAVNSSGPGPSSSSVTQRPGVPKAPTGVSASMSGDVLDLQWTAADDHGLGISSYEITVTQLTGRMLIQRTMAVANLLPRSANYSTTATNFAITGMNAGAYRISVRAINNYGPGLPAVTSIGSMGDDAEKWVGPAPRVQQFAAPSDATADRCEALAPADLNWSGVPSGGWGVSWAQWVNEGRGGSVCTRTLVYDRWQARWVLAA